MKKQIQDYVKAIKWILTEDKPGTDWKEVAQSHLIKIQFYQHERLIHLIVTALFAIMEIICLATLLSTANLWSLLLMIMVLVLLVPYIGHYYFLENSVQELYLIYDVILSRMDRKEKNTEEELED
ncbi:MAG: hypothetical protein E7295_08140 [Lachnospiraceae bacterium]|jgi:hypothetical protein|nr:hypothetical protein [Lachnospiraceae bacterium]